MVTKTNGSWSPSIILVGSCNNLRRKNMWTKPTYEKIRLGFEVTMYFKSV